MSLFFPQQTPRFEAALRDLASTRLESRLYAIEALAGAEGEQAERAKVALRPLLAAKEGPVRFAVLAALGRLADATALDAVLARFDDEDEHVREVAVIAAGQLGDRRAEPALRRALVSEHPAMRFQATVALAELVGDEAIPALVRALRDDNAEVRENTAYSLGELGAREHADDLAALLEDSSKGVKRTVALALAKLGDPRGGVVLRAALRDPLFAFEAAEALGEAHVTDARDDLARVATGFFRPLPLRAAAAGALVRLGDPRGVDVLRRILRAFRPDGRSYATELVGKLAIRELVHDLVALSRRPRGVDPTVLARALDVFADVPEARTARSSLGPVTS